MIFNNLRFLYFSEIGSEIQEIDLGRKTLKTCSNNRIIEQNYPLIAASF